MKTLGLIGFGQFGRLAAEHLRYQFDVLVSDPGPDAAEQARALGVKFGTLEEAAARQVVIVAVPVQAMRQVLAEIAPVVTPGALVIDVGSVKVLPAQWMAELLPDHVDIVATHPLFGPQSAKAGLSGLRLVVCPIRGERHKRVATVAGEFGLDVIIASPEEHDREMAYVQAISHLVGRALAGIGPADGRQKTRSYQHLLDLCGLIKDDTFELFTAIQTLNPYASEVTEAFMAEASALLEKARGDEGAS